MVSFELDTIGMVSHSLGTNTFGAFLRNFPLGEGVNWLKNARVRDPGKSGSFSP
jgi:hypothetical protein